MKIKLNVICVLLFFLFPVLVCAEEIVIVGTGSGPPILKEIGKVFSQKYPDVTVSLPRSIGSGGGIKAVGNDNFLLARVARKVKPSEAGYNLTYKQIALVPIIFYTSSNVEVKNLTNEQVCDIYSGKIFNWQQVGGKNARIRVVRRQDGDSSLNILLKSFPNFKNITITEFSKTTFSDPDTIELIEKTPNSIAFGDYSIVKGRAVNVLSIDDVSPATSEYPYLGTFGVVYKDKNYTGNIKKLIEFASSPAAFDAIKKGGGLPAL